MNRRLSRKHLLNALGTLGASASGLSASGVAAADSYTLRLNEPNPATSVHGFVSSRFAAAVFRRSSGQLKIEVYPNFQLAKQDETISALTTGVIDFAIIPTSSVV